MLDFTNEPDLGFIFYPYETEHPGHPRLDVIIHSKPTLRHYDPEKAQYHVASTAGHIEHLNIRHPWTLGTRYRVCAGRIILTDRKKKQVEAFSFGGDLQILSDTDHTVCGLLSPAPIFALFTTHDLPMWITAEVEILLAQQKAHWDPMHPHDFEAHLSKLDPFLLYTSCLQAIQERSAGHLNHELGELEHQGEHFVQTEIKRLQEKGEWPLLLPTLDQLFSLGDS
jgi:hypothetical protein